SGIIISVTALLDKNKNPSSQEVQNALDGHLCRCGSHSVVLRAIDSLIEN
ncbi:MAG: (2Fe-2S)-binding protein, partial [Flavobacteriales bacterium]|nr:(2Fe-2S)-binding protein [Flavobacteriales bacterium]